MHICLKKVSAYKHINHAFVKHISLFFVALNICLYVLFAYMAVFVSSRLPHSNFALDNTQYHNVKQL